jgi:hypothetical protein
VLESSLAQNTGPVDLGTNYTYLHAHMPKTNSSSVKICENSCPLLAQFLPAFRPKSLNCYPRRSSLCSRTADRPDKFWLRPGLICKNKEISRENTTHTKYLLMKILHSLARGLEERDPEDIF